MKFKVGDIVWCKIQGEYYYTDYHVKCHVVAVDEHRNHNGFICVRLIEGEIRSVWWVNPNHFEPTKATVI